MYVRNEVGSQVYVWTIGTKKNKQAVISAHGGQTIINSRFKIPGVRFLFYAPHEYLLKDPGLLTVIYGEVHPVEEVSDAKCPDYSLSKYQGAKHGSAAESYANIPAFGITEDELLNMGFKPTDIANMQRARDDLDIITIRNRRLRGDPTLKEVVKAVRAAGFAYDTIHCSFCRGPSGPFSKELGSHDAMTNQPGIR